jgi:DNA-binding MarR family transcriptional regulator
MTTKWLTEREMKAWLAYIETVGDLAAELERDLAIRGLTLGDYQVLVYLSAADDDSMRMCDLADALQLSPSGLTRRLDGLVKSQHVTRRPSVLDGRVMMAVLTSTGRALLHDAAPHHVTSVRRNIFDHLSPEQVDAMASIFESIAQGLEKSQTSRGVDDAQTCPQLAPHQPR